MNNLRGATLMVISMGCFALEDMFIKLMSESALPTGQILLMLGVFGGLSFTVMGWTRGQRILSRAYWHLGVQLRIFGEIIGTGCFVLDVDDRTGWYGNQILRSRLCREIPRAGQPG